MLPAERPVSSDWRPIPAPDWPDGRILFDGVCVLCSRWVVLVLARDVARRFRFVTVQSPAGRTLARELGIDPDEPQTNAAVLDGVAYLKSNAVLAVTPHLRGLAWTRWLRPLPTRLRDWLYDRIARNRDRLFGRHDACLVPGPDTAGRFLDGPTIGPAR